MDYLTVIIIICILFLFFIIFLIRTLQHNRINNSIIEGIWYVSNNFSKKSNLKNFIIYIKKGNGHIYDSFIMVTDNDDNMKKYEMPIKIIPKSYVSNTDFSFEFESCIPDIPKKIHMSINYEQTSMTLKCLKNNKTYGIFFKNNKLIDQIENTINKLNNCSDSDSDSDSDSEDDSEDDS